MRAYINDNRSLFAASFSTNWRRHVSDEPLAYNVASPLNDELVGEEPMTAYLVDVLDAIEALDMVDSEEMRDLVCHFLKEDHGISEAQLTDEEQDTLKKLTNYMRNLK